MRISLANVKVSRSLSEETLAFTADVRFDGQKIGDARNDGRGGQARVHIYGQYRAQVAEYVATLPAYDLGFGPHGWTLADLVDHLASVVDATNEITRKAKRNAVLLVPTDPAGSYRTGPLAGLDYFRKQFPSAVFANDDLPTFLAAYCDLQISPEGAWF
jgi:hypothetical protein